MALSWLSGKRRSVGAHRLGFLISESCEANRGENDFTLYVGLSIALSL